MARPKATGFMAPVVALASRRFLTRVLVVTDTLVAALGMDIVDRVIRGGLRLGNSKACLADDGAKPRTLAVVNGRQNPVIHLCHVFSPTTARRSISLKCRAFHLTSSQSAPASQPWKSCIVMSMRMVPYSAISLSVSGTNFS